MPVHRVDAFRLRDRLIHRGDFRRSRLAEYPPPTRSLDGADGAREVEMSAQSGFEKIVERFATLCSGGHGLAPQGTRKVDRPLHRPILPA